MRTIFIRLFLGAILLSATSTAIASVNLKEALEAFELKSVRFYASNQTDNCGWSVSVIDPKGYIHYARVGNYVGRHKGQIMRISESQVWVKEIYMDSRNGSTEKEVVIKLQHPETR